MSTGLQRAAAQYRRSQFAAMTPLERLLLTYRLAIEAANEGDEPRLMRALAALRAALRYDEHPGIALGLLHLYRHCENAVRTRGAFHEAVHVLDSLRNAWEGSARLHAETGEVVIEEVV